MSHTIKKQCFRVKFTGSESEGYALQSQLINLYNIEVLPEIEKIFDKCIATNRHLSIGNLQLDLGNFSLEKINSEFAPVFIKALNEKMEEFNAAIITDNNIVSKESQVTSSIQEHLLTVFIHFLKSGHLPWFYKMPIGKNLEEVISEVLIDNRDSSDTQTKREEIIRLLSENPIRIRLVQQFSEKFLLRFLKWISPEVAENVQKISPFKGNTLFTSEELRIISKSINQIALVTIADRHSINQSKFKAQIIKHLYETAWEQRFDIELPAKVFEVFSVDENLLLEIGQSEELAVGFKKMLLQKVEQKESKKAEQKPKKKKLSALGESTDSAISIDNEQSDTGSTLSELVIGEDLTDDGIYIENAGLVILHPFLPQLFNALGISENDKLINTNKALSLLNYMATGQKQMPEYNLVLPKVLCQVAITEPTPIEVQLKDNEMQESDNLLDAVIKHWEALRNTSREGLRSTFLLRSGKLSKKQDGDWLLQVENKSFDILLDQLPWGISMIKLPWMKQMLWVEWRL